ncbi:hypothetical protein BegalDRAFT_1844 [Beggiatoa alba B18LD]|uniref:Uncharacterized protein n=1 Tax=Beggiatoa alba B18LD TaxID=395493 RepID=I3CGH5_9GAMM|nr:hypothetical protein [Beggiatoa alba]EIJ42718.1 hypothetical protein BegalDRAFT_1844 [Beggiatoa alba B18LD]
MGVVIDALEKLFNSQVIIANGAQHAHVQLREDDSSAKLKKLTLKELEPNMLCLAP